MKKISVNIFVFIKNVINMWFYLTGIVVGIQIVFLGRKIAEINNEMFYFIPIIAIIAVVLRMLRKKLIN